MREYFHTYPTCPCCHEPHFSGSELEIMGENRFLCISCGSEFKNTVDFLEKDFSQDKLIFEETSSKLLKKKEDKNIISSIPLIWKIQNNSIETNYLNWIKTKPRGNYLITWPWDSVNFLPILINEYFLEYENRIITIITDTSKELNEKRKYITPTNIDNIFNYLLYNIIPIEIKYPDEIKKEMRKKDFLLFKRDFVYITVRHRKQKHCSSYFDCLDDFKECKKQVLEEIYETYGENSIHTLKEKKYGRRTRKKTLTEKIINPEGLIDVTLDCDYKYIRNCVYNTRWLWNLIFNPEVYRKLNKDIKLKIIRDENHLVLGDTNVYIIDSKINSDSITDILQKINPDLLLVQDFDDFMINYYFNKSQEKRFFNYIKERNNSLSLLFSLKKQVRRFYDFHSNSILDYYNLIPHTWDVEDILKYVKSKEDKPRVFYSNPLSNDLNDISTSFFTTKIEYEFVKKMDALESIVKLIKSSKNTPQIEKYDLIRFISNLKSSPLKIYGDYLKPEFFSRYYENIGTLELFLSTLLQNEYLSGQLDKIIEILKEIYDFDSENDNMVQRNPLYNTIIEVVSRYTKEDDVIPIIILHKNDIRGFKKLISEDNSLSSKLNNLEICGWVNLKDLEAKFIDTKKHIVFSTMLPSIYYSLYKSNADKFVFIGSSDKIEKIKKIIKYRLTESMMRPLSMLKETISSPKLLKDAQRNLQIESLDEFSEITEDLIFEFEEAIRTSSFSFSQNLVTQKEIEAGEDAILVLNKNDIGMFLSSDTNIFLMRDGKLDEISLNESLSVKELEKLINADIILDKNGIYLSFRVSFTITMLSFGEQVVFRKGPFEWKGFQNLLDSSTQWINDINKVIDYTARKQNISKNEAEEIIANKISELELFAKDPNYIKKWWTKFDVINTPEGTFKLHSIEHPKSLADLVKIYTWLENTIPELSTKIIDAERSYSASILIQGMRISLLKGKIKYKHKSFAKLKSKLENEIKDILKNTETFRILIIRKVKLTQNVKEYTMLKEFKDYV